MHKLAQIGGFLLDMDGTFYLGGQLLPGAAELIGLFRQRGMPFLFLTNNSSRTQVEYAEKIRRMGVDISEDAIFTSGEASAIYLADRKPGASLFVVGTPALEGEFAAHGFTLTTHKPDFAVLGFDTTLTYQKLWLLCEFVADGVPYIATHPDLNCPTENGFMPDIGAMIAFVAASTGRQPDVVIGKPHRPIINSVTKRLGLPVEKLCMVGDRLYTDIALGNTGVTTVLVLSGETKRDDLADSPFQPDFVMENLAELASFMSVLL